MCRWEQLKDCGMQHGNATLIKLCGVTGNCTWRTVGKSIFLTEISLVISFPHFFELCGFQLALSISKGHEAPVPFKNCDIVPGGPNAGRCLCLVPWINGWYHLFVAFHQTNQATVSTIELSLPSSSGLCNSQISFIIKVLSKPFLLWYLVEKVFRAQNMDKIQHDGSTKAAQRPWRMLTAC